LFKETPVFDLETLTIELFQLIVMRKVQGRTWGEIAEEVPLTVRELERVPWHFPDEWDRDFARAERLQRHDLLAPCITKVQAALLAASEPNHLGILTRSLVLLLKPLPNAERGTRQAERSTRSERKIRNEEREDEAENDAELPDEEAAEVKTPEQQRVEEVAELLEKHEDRVFQEELHKLCGQNPVLLARIQEAAQKHAGCAPDPNYVEPEPPTPAPTPTNTSTAKKAAGWAALIFVLFFWCRGFSRAAHADHHAYDTITTPQPIEQPPHIWPLSGDD
jgi:hypothetical protein